MTHSYHIRKSLTIEDPNILFNPQQYILSDQTIKKVTYKRFQATLTYTPKACEKCGTVNEDYTVIKNGTKTSTLKLGNMMFQPTLLLLKKQRFLCKACGSTFTASTSLVQKHCFISNLFKQHIMWELQEVQAMKTIASRCAVSSHTVARVLKRIGQSLEPKQRTLPVHLSFDEFKSVKEAAGSMSFVFTNAETHEPIDILENRQQADLLAYFQRYPYSERAKVETVTLDMYAPYISVIQQVFPHAQLIIDRFHYHLMRSKERPVKRYLRTVFQTLERYLTPIKNAFVYTLSNGHLEGINNKIKTIKRSGYGYRNFSNLRARILISFNLTKRTDKPVRPLYRKDEQQTA